MRKLALILQAWPFFCITTILGLSGSYRVVYVAVKAGLNGARFGKKLARIIWKCRWMRRCNNRRMAESRRTRKLSMSVCVQTCMHMHPATSLCVCVCVHMWPLRHPISPAFPFDATRGHASVADHCPIVPFQYGPPGMPSNTTTPLSGKKGLKWFFDCNKILLMVVAGVKSPST